MWNLSFQVYFEFSWWVGLWLWPIRNALTKALPAPDEGACDSSCFLSAGLRVRRILTKTSKVRPWTPHSSLWKWVNRGLGLGSSELTRFNLESPLPQLLPRALLVSLMKEGRVFVVLARRLTLAICLVSCRHGNSRGDVSAAEAPWLTGVRQAGAGWRLGRGGDSPGSEEGRRAGVSDHPQRALYGVLAPQRAPPKERLRLRHCQQTDLSDLPLWEGEHVTSLHRRLPHQTLRVHDSGVQVGDSTHVCPVSPWAQNIEYITNVQYQNNNLSRNDLTPCTGHPSLKLQSRVASSCYFLLAWSVIKVLCWQNCASPHFNSCIQSTNKIVPKKRKNKQWPGMSARHAGCAEFVLTCIQQGRSASAKRWGTHHTWSYLSDTGETEANTQDIN